MGIKNKLVAAAGASAITIATVLVGFFEGKKNDAYLDVVGVPTICYGETKNVRLGDHKTDKECDAMLQSELQKTLQTVDKLVKTPLKETQRAALASFIYNVGEGAFARSTLLKKLNRGDVAGACKELDRWVYAGGRKWKGLMTRREVEKWLCLM